MLKAGNRNELIGLDYDAPLSEAGDYTNKYKSIQLLIPAALAVQTRLPKPPYNKPKRAYASVAVESYLSFSDLVEQVVITIKFFFKVTSIRVELKSKPSLSTHA